MIIRETIENVEVVKLNHGITNAINLDLVDELTECLMELKNDLKIHSLVLTSSNEKFFAIGFNLPELIKLSLNEFKEFYESFNQLSLDLYSFPKPTIAALTGHAIAGGCILALCCDYRFISEGRKLMGLNEIKLGVPVPYPGECILKQVVGPLYTQDITYTGYFYPSDKLLQMNMVDKIIPLEQVLSESINLAKSLGSMPQEAFSQIKINQTEMVIEHIRKHLEKKEKAFIKLWFSNETQERLKEAAEVF